MGWRIGSYQLHVLKASKLWRWRPCFFGEKTAMKMHWRVGSYLPKDNSGDEDGVSLKKDSDKKISLKNWKLDLHDLPSSKALQMKMVLLWWNDSLIMKMNWRIGSYLSMTWNLKGSGNKGRWCAYGEKTLMRMHCKDRKLCSKTTGSWCSCDERLMKICCRYLLYKSTREEKT